MTPRLSERGIAVPPAMRLEQHGHDDDGALDDLLHERRDAGEIEDVGEHRENGGADHCPYDPAFAAEKARSADDGYGDRFEFQTDAGRRAHRR